MNPRDAVKGTIHMFLRKLMEEDKMEWLGKEDLDRVIEEMHDDDTFLDTLEEFFENYIEDFGENYGL